MSAHIVHIDTLCDDVGGQYGVVCWSQARQGFGICTCTSCMHGQANSRACAQLSEHKDYHNRMYGPVLTWAARLVDDVE